MSRILFIGLVWKTHDAPCHGRKRFRMDRRKSVTRTPRLCGWVGGWLKGSELKGVTLTPKQYSWELWFHYIVVHILSETTHMDIMALLAAAAASFWGHEGSGDSGVRGTRGTREIWGRNKSHRPSLFDIILKTVCHTSVLCTKCVSHFSKSNCE